MGVSRLVTFGGKPATVEDAIVALPRSMEGINQVATQRIFNSGDRVQVTEGAFAGFAAIHQAVDGTACAMVLIEFLSKQVQIGALPEGLSKVP
jgi:transcriptional antiterminator RfaH